MVRYHVCARYGEKEVWKIIDHDSAVNAVENALISPLYSDPDYVSAYMYNNGDYGADWHWKEETPTM